MKDITEFRSVIEVVKYFKNEKFNLKYLAEKRWGGNPVCPRCGHDKVYIFGDKITYKCASCRERFNAKTNSMYEGTKLPLQTWYVAIYEILANKGISSYTLAQKLNITQTTAWYRLKTIRQALAGIEKSDTTKMSGKVEIDETFVGGKNKNRHKNKKFEKSQGRSFKDKTPVMGILQRGVKLRARVVLDTSAEEVLPHIFNNVRKGSKLMTDEWGVYAALGTLYKHKIVNHAGKQYVNNDVYTNGLENFWSILKCGIIGIYKHVSRRHLDDYVQEYVFRYNQRKNTMKEKFEKVLISGDRLKYQFVIKRPCEIKPRPRTVQEIRNQEMTEEERSLLRIWGMQ